MGFRLATAAATGSPRILAMALAKTFRTRDDAIKAFNRGEIAATDTVRILE